MKQRLQIPRPFTHYSLTWVFILGVSMLAVIMFSYHLGRGMVERSVPLQDACIMIKTELVEADLALDRASLAKKQAGGDEGLSHLARAEWLANAMLSGGSDDKHAYAAVNDALLRREIQDTLGEIRKIRRLAEKRLASGIKNKAAALELGREFDSAVVRAYNQSGLLEKEFYRVMRGQMAAYTETVFGLVALSLLLTLLAWLGFRRYGRMNAEYIEALDKSRERLRESLEKTRLLSAAVEESPDAIQVVGLDGRIVYSSKAVYGIYGFSPEEFQGRHVNEMNEDPVFADRVILPAIREKGWWRGELNVRHKDGHVFPIWLTTALVRDDDGRPVSSIGVIRDITERKKAEEELADRARLATLGAEVGVALTEGETLGKALRGTVEAMVKNLGAAFARIWILSEKEDVLELQASAGMYTHTDGPHGRIPLGVGKVGVIARDRRPRLTNAVVGDPEFTDQGWAKREGMAAFAGYPLVVEDRLIGVMALFSRRPLAEAALQALESISRELTIGIDRKRSEARLRESEELYRSLFDNSMDAIILAAPDGTYYAANRAAAAMFGRPEEELCRLGREGIVDPADPRAKEYFRERGEKGGSRGEFNFIKGDGTRFPAEVTSSVFRDKDGRPRAVVIIRDITQRREVEAYKTDFVSMVAHDLKSPLTVLLSYASLILENKSGAVDPDTLEMVEAMRNSGQKLQRLVEDFLTVTKIESAGLALRLRPEDVAAILRETAGELASVAERKGLALSVEAREGLPVAQLDARQMERVFYNLIQNAISYTPRGGSVSVRADEASLDGRDCLRVSVKDTGCGIPPEERDKVFEKYYRSPRISGVKGFGLGLSVVKAVVEAHKGRVELESEMDAGSKFTVYLPLS